MAVLVTGGAGFIGSHLCESLLQDGNQVICLDNVSSGRNSNLEPFIHSNSFTFIQGDINSKIAPQIRGETSSEKLDSIYHLASRASPVDFQSHPLDIAWTSANGTRNILEFARSINARVLLVSTSEVYGNPRQHPQTEDYNGNVDPRGPRACYDEGKRFAETLSTIYERQFGLDVRTVRPFNTYGPRMRPDDGRVIPTFVKQALLGEDLTVYGDGTQTRSFLYVSDQVRAMRRLLEQDGLSGEVVNVGSTNEITISQFADIVLSVTGSDSSITHKQLPKDDPERRRPDISRVKDLLNWGAKTPLREGIKQTAQYFRQHEITE